MCRHFIWSVVLGQHSVESISHQDMMQCSSGLGWVQILTLYWPPDSIPHCCSVLSLLRMLNRALKCFLPLFRCFQHCRYIRLLVWWLLNRYIDLWCNHCIMEATIESFFSASEPLILSLYVPSKVLYTFVNRHCSQIACGGIWATQLTWMHSICFICRLFNSMLKVITATMYQYLISVYTGKFICCNGSCAILCTIDVSRE
jgi:hypothetical protein